MSSDKIKRNQRIRRLKFILLYISIVLFLFGVLLSFPFFRSLFSGRKDPLDSSLFSVHYLDVGQGDCMLLLSQNGEAALIDAGTDDNANYIIAYLKKYGVKKLTYFFVTHPHTDHMGSASAVLSEIPTEQLIHNGDSADSYPAVLLRELTKENRVPCLVPSAGDRFTLGNGIIEVLSTPSLLLEENDNSLVLKLIVGETGFLFMGDCEKAGELNLLSHSCDLSADVLKIGHHGSGSGTSDALLDHVCPGYAVICAGRNNDYGHPHVSVLDRLRNRNILTLVTAEDGNVVFCTDGTAVSLVSRNRHQEALKP